MMVVPLFMSGTVYGAGVGLWGGVHIVADKEMHDSCAAFNKDPNTSKCTVGNQIGLGLDLWMVNVKDVDLGLGSGLLDKIMDYEFFIPLYGGGSFRQSVISVMLQGRASIRGFFLGGGAGMSMINSENGGANHSTQSSNEFSSLLMAGYSLGSGRLHLDLGVRMYTIFGSSVTSIIVPMGGLTFMF